MTKINKVEVNWWENYSNSPELVVHVDKRPNHYDFFYQRIESDFPSMLISVNMYPFIKFVYIVDPHGDPSLYGALGNKYKLDTGEVLPSRTGWSSRAGIINNKYRKYVPNDIIDIVLYEDGRTTGWAGFAIDVDYIRALLPRDVYLVRKLQGGDVTWYPSTDPNMVRKP